MNAIKMILTNRFFYVFVGVIIAMSTLISCNNPYRNAIVMPVIFGVYIVAVAYIMEAKKHTKSEKVFMKKLENLFD